MSDPSQFDFKPKFSCSHTIFTLGAVCSLSQFHSTDSTVFAAFHLLRYDFTCRFTWTAACNNWTDLAGYNNIYTPAHKNQTRHLARARYFFIIRRPAVRPNRCTSRHLTLISQLKRLGAKWWRCAWWIGIHALHRPRQFWDEIPINILKAHNLTNCRFTRKQCCKCEYMLLYFDAL